jgi:hypothetical protein
MAIQGTKIFCPGCKTFSVCTAIPLYKLKQPKARRWYITDHTDIQWFRRGRKCVACSHQFLTAEMNEEFIAELVDLRARLAERNRIIIKSIRAKATWIDRKETIPVEIARGFIEHSALWLTHPSGYPVRARRHASRIYNSRHGWAVDFGANSFLVGKAIERCAKEINEFFKESESGKLLNIFDLKDLKEKLHKHISGAVSNNDGYEYNGYYPIADGQLVFGAQAINVRDGANYLVNKLELNKLFTGDT